MSINIIIIISASEAAQFAKSALHVYSFIVNSLLLLLFVLLALILLLLFISFQMLAINFHEKISYWTAVLNFCSS